MVNARFIHRQVHRLEQLIVLAPICGYSFTQVCLPVPLAFY